MLLSKGAQWQRNGDWGAVRFHQLRLKIGRVWTHMGQCDGGERGHMQGIYSFNAFHKDLLDSALCSVLWCDWNAVPVLLGVRISWRGEARNREIDWDAAKMVPVWLSVWGALTPRTVFTQAGRPTKGQNRNRKTSPPKISPCVYHGRYWFLLPVESWKSIEANMPVLTELYQVRNIKTIFKKRGLF